jgi:hypothetical protein
MIIKKTFNSSVEAVMLKRLHLVARSNNDGKPDDAKVSRPVWGEE